MINIDWILSTAINTLKSTMPEAIYSGFLISKNREFIASENETVSTETSKPVEIIIDKMTSLEIQASGLLATDLKFHIIGDKNYDINFYQHISFNGSTYRFKQLVESLVGSKVAIWTIIATK